MKLSRTRHAVTALAFCLLGTLFVFPTPACAQTDAGLGRVERTLDGEREIRTRIEAFFGKLEAKDVAGAFADLFKGSPQSKDPKIVSGFVQKTGDIMMTYGQITSHELLTVKRVGSRIVRFTYLSHSDNYPLKWEVFCYRGKSGWQLLDFAVNSDIASLFGSAEAKER